MGGGSPFLRGLYFIVCGGNNSLSKFKEPLVFISAHVPSSSFVSLLHLSPPHLESLGPEITYLGSFYHSACTARW